MKFTAIICSYNPNIEWLKRAVKSTFGLFDEIILVDDGSTVPIPSLYNKDDMLGFDKVMMVRHETNKGFAAAKNTAISFATGDIICTVDDDDYFDAEGVVKLKEFINTNDSDIWHFPLRKFGDETGLYGVNADPSLLPEHNSIPGISWYKRSLWEELGGFKILKAEDWSLWLRAFNAGKKFTYFPEVVYNYHKRNDSVSAGWRGPKFEEIKKEVYNNL